MAPWADALFSFLAHGAAWLTLALLVGIIISLFILFNCFALVQWAQYKRVGKYANYLHGERTYIVLSLVAKSLLAWQIFAGTLAP